MLNQLFQMSSITVPYFSITKGAPANDLAPRAPTGIFGPRGRHPRYIREEKFTFACLTSPYGGSSTILSLSPLYHVERSESKRQPAAGWVCNNLRHIWWKWEEVLDFLDEQTALPVSETADWATILRSWCLNLANP